MDVFLIPTTTPECYELYYEAPDEDVRQNTDDNGFFPRVMRSRVVTAVMRWGWVVSVRASFAETLREAEEWRHRRHEEQPRPKGFIAKWRRKLMGFVVERIAEQRLLWHMRYATQICAAIPADLAPEEADRLIRRDLKRDADHHFKWVLIDGLLLLVSLPLTLIPGPNPAGFYFTFQVVGHFLSMRGAKQGLAVTEWTYKASADLAELRQAMALDEAARQPIFQQIAQRLQLEHLATFCEDVAAPPA
ncbi:MAG TPA: hypothetical protein VNJ02_17300 [Vicinamibacterales bacterium]|nr:hypothetical protein [Vicinamibacterales bacterium]